MAVELDTIVVTPSLLPQRAKDAPGSVQVIDAETIRRTGADTAAGALEGAVGLDLDHVAGRGLIPQIRGLTNKRVLVLLDGMRFSSGFRDTTLDLTELPAEIIQRIEVVRGPASALYGSDAIGGVVNIITRKPPEVLSGSGTLQYGATTEGEGGNLVVKGFLGNTWNGLGVSLAGQGTLSQEYDRELDDDVSDFDDETRHSGMLNLHYQLGPDQAVSGGVFFSDTNRQGLRPKYGLRWDRDADSDRLSSFARYDGQFGNTSLMARVYYSDFGSDRSYVEVGAPYSDPARQKTAQQQPDREDFDITNELVQMELRASHLLADSHLLTLGLEYREEERSGIENRGEEEVDETVDNRAVFLQDSFRLGDPLEVTAGVRVDDYSSFGTEISPRLGLVYAPRDDWRLKATYGQGFRAPSVYELYVYTENQKGDVIPNPDLDAETATSYELGLEGEKGPFSGAVTLFRNDIDDMIYKEPTGNFRQSGKKRVLEYTRVNISEAYTQGVEAQGDLFLGRGFTLVGNFTYVDAENEDTGEPLLEVPETKTFVKLAYDDPSGRWHANLRVTRLGEQIIAPQFEDGSQDVEDPYTVVNLYAERTMATGLKLFAGIDNLFDEIPDYTPDKGVYVYAGISGRF